MKSIDSTPIRELSESEQFNVASRMFKKCLDILLEAGASKDAAVSGLLTAAVYTRLELGDDFERAGTIIWLRDFADHLESKQGPAQ